MGAPPETTKKFLGMQYPVRVTNNSYANQQINAENGLYPFTF